MKILSFDTSSSSDSCTIYDSEKGALSEFRFNIPAYKSENILNVIEINLNILKLKISDIDIIAVCGGPGSFTGTRIGISTALGLSKGTNIEYCTVNLLDILAYSVDNGRIVPFISNKDYIYFAEYKKEDEKLIRKSDYLKYNFESFSDFVKNNEALYISEKIHTFNNICFDNTLTKSTIIAKIVGKYKNEDLDKSISTFYL